MLQGLRQRVIAFHCLHPQEGAVVALFKICRQDRFRDLYAHALRTVASICCVEEGIDQLDKVSGKDSTAVLRVFYTDKYTTVNSYITIREPSLIFTVCI